MIHTTENFFNKVATEVRENYFQNENHGTTENPNYWKATQIMESFNNGELTYKVFIGRLSKACQTNNATIHNLVEKHIVSFGNYQYKPGKLYSENTKVI
jgi:ABC-type enterochelin transport system ATPase subunit